MFRFNCSIISLILLVASSFIAQAEEICDNGDCWQNFVPAPPGKTPTCAKNGLTYCQHVYGYPAERIHKLLESNNAQNFLTSEKAVDFKPKEQPINYRTETFQARPPPVRVTYPVFQSNTIRHGPNNPTYKYVPSNNYNYKQNSGQPNGFVDPIFIPKPNVENGWTFYNQPVVQNYQYRPPRQNSNYYYPQLPQVTAYNPSEWLKRYARDITQSAHNDTSSASSSSSFSAAPQLRRKRQVSFNNLVNFPFDDFHQENVRNMFLEQIGSRSRTKRQIFDSGALCQTRSYYVDPQAALNVNGDWKYVVNSNPQTRQMVKAEVCASQTCSNLCSLPNRYTSKCEQKYVQKRLVALQGDGATLYTDIFWFPSCCICTISTT